MQFLSTVFLCRGFFKLENIYSGVNFLRNYVCCLIFLLLSNAYDEQFKIFRALCNERDFYKFYF